MEGKIKIGIKKMFDDKNTQPTDEMLSQALGATFDYWKQIIDYLKSEIDGVLEDWKFYGKKYGWQLKMLKKKRNLLFLIPSEGVFSVVFVFGDKAVAAVEQSDLPDTIKTELANAKKYMEGRGIKIEINSADEVEHVKKLVRIKVAN
jgi:hypothetical protein